MFKSAFRWLTVRYTPRADVRSFMERAQTQSDAEQEVTAAVLSAQETRQLFGVNAARRGVQPLWVRIANQSDGPVWLDLFSIDHAYYTPLEAAYVNHLAVAKRFVGFGAIGYLLFLPLLPFAIFKAFAARRANKRMNAFFREQGFEGGPIHAARERSGFVFCPLDEGVKNVNIEIISDGPRYKFSFSFEVPGLVLSPADAAHTEPADLVELDEDALRRWLEQQPRAATNKRETNEADPLNLVVVGDRALLLRCFGASWDQVEAITLKTSLKMAKAFLLDSEYRYSPVSSLFHAGRPQDLALQMARANVHERIHLRLWRAEHSFGGRQVWIGQVSRDIGVRFTTRTWNLTTHKIDPDVDESRDYVMGCLMAGRHVSRLGYVSGAVPAPESAPRHNLTGDPYFTDGLRAVLVLSPELMEPAFLGWSKELLVAGSGPGRQK